MQTRFRVQWCLVLALIVALFAPTAPLFAISSPGAATGPFAAQLPQPPFPLGYVWSRWGAEQYALAQDGDDLWIGSGSGVLRRNIPTATSTRYTTIDGLPSFRIYAVAVDGAGNRWFGGDRGLSRLDASGVWTHFTSSNSGLHEDTVFGIAVGADGTLWLAHGLPEGSVSRRNPDGSWLWAPNRTAVVMRDYAAVVQTQNVNPLWTVSGDEVWIGFAVFNGSQWLNRTPEGAVRLVPQSMAATSSDVWVLSADDNRILHWTGAGWEALPPINVEPPGSAGLSTYYRSMLLSVGRDGRLWAGGMIDIQHPKGWQSQAVIVPVLEPEQARFVDAEVEPPSALVAGDGGVGGAGSGWLITPAGDTFFIRDAPEYSTAYHAIAGGDNTVWLHSTYDIQGWDRYYASQGVNDMKTTALPDDQWQAAEQKLLLAADRSPGGDVWLGWQWYEPYPCISSSIDRFHEGQWIDYSMPHSLSCAFPTDIFAQDEQNTWFTYLGPSKQDGSNDHGVLHLDDGGTPAEPADDRWTDYPFVPYSKPNSVAVDDSIWLANDDGLYRWQNNNWVRQGTDYDRDYCELTVAGEGLLMAQVDYSGACEVHGAEVSLIQVGADGVVSKRYGSVDQFLRDNWAIARNITRRNPLFARATDGSVWYVNDDTICRRTGKGEEVQCAPLPETMSELSQVEVDGNNHVWFTGNGALWRLAPWPSIVLHPNTAFAWMTPSSSERIRSLVQPLEGFEGEVGLSLGPVPDGFSASLAPSTLQAGLAVSVDITATAAVAPGVYQMVVRAAGMSVPGPITTTATIDIRVAEEVHLRRLPLVSRP